MHTNHLILRFNFKIFLFLISMMVIFKNILEIDINVLKILNITINNSYNLMNDPT